jgi:hypothetical protein
LEKNDIIALKRWVVPLQSVVEEWLARYNNEQLGFTELAARIR